MRKFFKNRIVITILAITISVSVILGVINATRSKSTIVENIAMVTVTPIQHGFSWIGRTVTGFFGYFGDIDELRAENERLESENKKLSRENRRAESYKKENEELRTLLALGESYPSLELVAAEVVSRSASNWYENFTIDKGTAHGLKLNQGVITEDNALIGRISDIGSTWARVTTITDPDHSVGAKIIRSGELGVVEGDASLADKGQCRLSFISANGDVVVGDYIETSGLGGVYPKGIEIGKVISISTDVQGISKYAVIETSVNAESVTKVMVITSTVAED